MTAISPRPGWLRSGRCWTQPDQLGGGVAIRPVAIVEGYRAWAEAYDQPGNQLIDLEQPIIWEILDSLPWVRRWTLPAAPAATPSTWPHSAMR
jgi:hypothetical protein